MSHCLQCKASLDMHSDPQQKGRQPDPGDLSICAHCGHVMVFGDNLELRGPTEKEMENIMRDQELIDELVMLSVFQKSLRDENTN